MSDLVQKSQIDLEMCLCPAFHTPTFNWNGQFKTPYGRLRIEMSLLIYDPLW